MRFKLWPALLSLLSLLFAACGVALPAPTGDRAPPASLETKEVPTATTIERPLPAQEVTTAAPPEPGFDPAGLAIGPGQAFQVLDEPRVIAAEAAHWLEPDDIVLGVIWNSDARAYPVSQMAYHHIANDTIAGEPFLVTY